MTEKKMARTKLSDEKTCENNWGQADLHGAGSQHTVTFLPEHDCSRPANRIMD